MPFTFWGVLKNLAYVLRNKYRANRPMGRETAKPVMCIVAAVIAQGSINIMADMSICERLNVLIVR
jgi:hypothetical protein